MGKEGAAAVAEVERFLSFDDILNAEDTTYEAIEVPEWGGRIRIGSLSAGAILEFVEANEGPAKRTAGLRLLIASLVDERGNRIGTTEKLQQFKNKDQKVVNRLLENVLKLNGMDKKAEEALKNASGEAASGASPTA